jgi:hypothetical protein
VAAVRAHDPTSLEEVRFVLFGGLAYDAFRAALQT